MDRASGLLVPRQQVNLGTAIARGGRLSHLQGLKLPLQGSAQLHEAITLKTSDQHVATKFQVERAKLRGQFGKHHHARLIDHSNARHIGGHARKHKVPATSPDARPPWTTLPN